MGQDTDEYAANAICACLRRKMRHTVVVGASCGNVQDALIVQHFLEELRVSSTSIFVLLLEFRFWALTCKLPTFGQDAGRSSMYVDVEMLLRMASESFPCEKTFLRHFHTSYDLL